MTHHIAIRSSPGTPEQVSTSHPRYAVWAPRAHSLLLQLGEERIPMTRRTDDWWIADREPRHGDRYGFIVNGEGPFPDPRSRSQPEGPHLLSEWIDHQRFDWSDDQWQALPLASGVLYELHVGTFSDVGTFSGAVERLAYLAELGVTHVELMPIAEFSGERGWGYDGVDLFAPHHPYGTPEDFKRFVDACHAHGLAVIVDVVYNHLGPAGNYLSRFGPYFTGRYNTPWGDAINLDDAGADEVRRFLCDNAISWLRDYHVDGLRIDAVHTLIDTSARHFLEQLADEVDTLEAVLGRHLILVAESDLNDPRVIRAREAGGFGIDAQWSDDFHHAVHSVLTGERSGYYEDFGALDQLAAVMRRGFVYTGARSPHRRRAHGREPHDMPGWRFVVAVQNHDQIGNRARGERLSHLLSPQRARIAAALLLTAPFVPLIFQGEEWAASSPFQYFTAHEDPALAAMVSAGRKREFSAFGWTGDLVPDPQSPDTFERSRLRWNERGAGEHAAMLDWYRSLIALRRTTPSLRTGRLDDVSVLFDGSASTLTVARGSTTVAINLGPDPHVVPVPGASRLLISSSAGIRLDGGELELPPDSVAVVERGWHRTHVGSGI